MPDLFVVVDPEFGDRLDKLTQSAPIWIVATPGNESAYKRLWRTHPHADHREKGAVTCYTVSDSTDRVANLLDIVSQLELHHGQFQTDQLYFPRGFVLEVIGLPLCDAVTLGLGEYRFSSFVRTAEGFQAQIQ